jgi:solute carrier family 35 protein E1
VAPAYGTVAFSNIIKTAEPLFTCALSVLLYRRSFPLATYASLLAIVAGVSLFSANDLDFHYFSLIAGMVSNAGYAMYSIRAKAALQRLPQLSPRELFAIITLGGCAVLSPIALIFELCGAGATGVVKDPSNAIRGWKLVRLLGFTGFIQYLSNEIAFCTLPLIHPVTYAVANTMKRSLVVAVSLLFFGRSLPLRGMAGALLALSGALAYSMSMQNWRRKRPRKSATRRSHPEPITRVRAAPDSGAATVAQAF